jgi:hypothetical protein
VIQVELEAVSKAFWVVAAQFPALNKPKTAESRQTGTLESFFMAGVS